MKIIAPLKLKRTLPLLKLSLFSLYRVLSSFGSQFITAPFPSFYYYNPPCYPPYPPVGNEWYNLYLSYVPPSNMIQRQTLFSKMLKNGPEIKIPDIPPKASGKVLTSAEQRKRKKK